MPGVTRKGVHLARRTGRIPAERAANGDGFIRRHELLALILDNRAPRRQLLRCDLSW